MLYKSFEKVYLGISDIASLVIRDADGARELRFGSDGDYSAYECFGDVEIGEHYKNVDTARCWLKIYDDCGLVYNKHSCESSFSICDIYRAGDFGCILHWHD